jgi:hypothetical protein
VKNTAQTRDDYISESGLKVDKEQMVYPYRFLPIPQIPQYSLLSTRARAGLGVGLCHLWLRPGGTGKSLVLYKEGLIDLEPRFKR